VEHQARARRAPRGHRSMAPGMPLEHRSLEPMQRTPGELRRPTQGATSAQLMVPWTSPGHRSTVQCLEPVQGMPGELGRPTQGVVPAQSALRAPRWPYVAVQRALEYLQAEAVRVRGEPVQGQSDHIETQKSAAPGGGGCEENGNEVSSNTTWREMITRLDCRSRQRYPL